MGIFNKLATLARGAARESAEVLLDANAVRVFEQEIVDVEQSILQRKQAMSEVIVAHSQINREIESLNKIILKREDQAKVLLEDNADNDLLDEIASDILQYEEMYSHLEEQRKGMDKRIQIMKTALRKALSEVTQYRRDLRLAKAQQISLSGLAKANNLPKQLSELECTRRHVMSLQVGDDDQENAWVEMENCLDPHGQNQRYQKLNKADHDRKKALILRRLGGKEKTHVKQPSS
ncbi:PspA/IM30 family protein [Neptunomonas sp.]|uniref:PspA/IM30 family protein n=1 Tax=Neptunomonas sp. TaxID=1971898 RepID=UPI0025CF4D9A|nr:PspA/IM30 family protein [Neptunomonas sp.]